MSAPPKRFRGVQATPVIDEESGTAIVMIESDDKCKSTTGASGEEGAGISGPLCGHDSLISKTSSHEILSASGSVHRRQPMPSGLSGYPSIPSFIAQSYMKKVRLSWKLPKYKLMLLSRSLIKSLTLECFTATGPCEGPG